MNASTSIEVIAEPSASVPPIADQAAPVVRELIPHPQLLRVWIWGALTVVVPLTFAGLMISIFADHWFIAPLVALIGACIIGFTMIYSRAYLARFRCRLLADGLWVDRGVWWRSETFVPRARVQHTEVQQGPIARRYGMASLKVFTAGASHGEIEIDGLIHSDALWLRDELLGRQGQESV
jgi:uncharacterized protein